MGKDVVEQAEEERGRRKSLTQKQAINDELSRIQARKDVVDQAEEERGRKASLLQMSELQHELYAKGLIEEPASSCGTNRRKSLSQSLELRNELKSIAIKAGMNERDAEVYEYQG